MNDKNRILIPKASFPGFKFKLMKIFILVSYIF